MSFLDVCVVFSWCRVHLPFDCSEVVLLLDVVCTARRLYAAQLLHNKLPLGDNNHTLNPEP